MSRIHYDHHEQPVERKNKTKQQTNSEIPGSGLENQKGNCFVNVYESDESERKFNLNLESISAKKPIKTFIQVR